MLTIELVRCIPPKLNGDKVVEQMKRGTKPPIGGTVDKNLGKWPTETCSVKKNMYEIKPPNCDKIWVDQGLCFGFCNSIYIPGSKLRLNQMCLPKYKKTPVEVNCIKSGKKAKRILFYRKIIACSCRKVTVDWG